MAQQQRQPAPPPQQTPRGQIPPQPQNQQGLTQPGSESNTQLPSRARQIILGGYDDNQTRYQRGFTDGFRLGVSVGFELGQEDIPPPARWFEDRQREEQNNTEAGNTNGNGGGAQQNSRWFEEQRINRARNTSTETTSATEEEARWFYEHNTTSGLHTWRRNN